MEWFSLSWIKESSQLLSQTCLKYGFCSRLYTIEVTADDADIDLLFHKMTIEPIIVLILYYLLSNLVHTISDPKGTHMSCLGVIQRCIKTHLYPVAFIGMCNFCHCIWVFIFYFIFIVYYVISQLSACTSDTYDQSIKCDALQLEGRTIARFWAGGCFR